MNEQEAVAVVRRVLYRVQNSPRKAMRERIENFAGQGYGGDDLLRRVARIPLVSECGHGDQPGPYCGLCGGPMVAIEPYEPGSPSGRCLVCGEDGSAVGVIAEPDALARAYAGSIDDKLGEAMGG